MRGDIAALTDREKEALRLLLAGHDAKSTARELDLSVHTVNDYLRSARKKLRVASSREAARLLGNAESLTPENSAAEQFGIAGSAGPMPGIEPSPRRPRGYPLVWLGGGMLIMSLIIAAAIIATQSTADRNRSASLAAAEAQAGLSTSASQAHALPAARKWIVLLDGGKWADSYRAADAFFRSQVSEDGWAKAARSVREPLGAVVSRIFASVTSAETLPGAPKGEYEIIAFTTSFANRRDATETVIMRREGESWQVVGYFIR